MEGGNHTDAWIRTMEIILRKPEMRSGLELHMTLFHSAMLRRYKRPKRRIVKAVGAFLGQRENEIDLREIETTFNKFPSLSDLSRILKTCTDNTGPSSLSPMSLSVLQTILCSRVNFVEKPVQAENYNITASSSTRQSDLPDFHFSVNLPSDPEFDQLCLEHGTRTVFHGSPTGNWHSIIHLGLEVRSNTRASRGAIFGAGIYFSEDLAMARGFSKFSPTWKHSTLGPSIQCVGVYKLANHPKFVRSHREDHQKGDVRNSVPPKYFVVSGSRYVQLTDVLVWKRDPPRTALSLRVLLAYVVLLLAIVLARNFDWR
eukprot:1001095_1